MIELSYHGGLGNTLFQYAFARILHERTGLRVSVHPTRYTQHLTGKLIQRDSLTLAGFPATNAPLDGPTVTEPLIWLPGNNTHDNLNGAKEPRTDLDALLRVHPQAHFALAGFFQRYSYYKPWKDRLRNAWLRTDIQIPASPGPRDVVAYVQAQFNVRPAFYSYALRRLSFDKLYVLVSDPQRAQAHLRAMARYKPIVVHNQDPLHDFEFLRRAHTIVQAPSSFAWWASWLSDAHTILTALPDADYGSRTHGVAELEVDDEPRFQYLPHCTARPMKQLKNKLRKLLRLKKPGFERAFIYGGKIPVVDQIRAFAQREPFAASIRTFVETGTCEGETIEAASKYFAHNYTIELSPALHAAVSGRLAHTGIHFELGDSAEVLPRLARDIKEPAAFYLDAHFSGGETARGPEDVPLLRELAILGKRPYRDLIIIDDASLFGHSPKDGLNEDWSLITRESLLAAFGGANVRHVLEHDRMILWRTA